MTTAPTKTQTIEEAVAAYEAAHGTGYSSLELGQHLYHLQKASRLSEELFGTQDDAWDDHIRIRTTAWLRRRLFSTRGVSARQYVAWANKRMAEPLDTEALERRLQRRYEWGGLATVMTEQASADAAAMRSTSIGSSVETEGGRAVNRTDPAPAFDERFEAGLAPSPRLAGVVCRAPMGVSRAPG